MRAHFRTDSTSFANSFLVVAMVAGALTLDVFEGDAVSGYCGHTTLYPIELVLNAEVQSPCQLFSVSENIPDVDVVGVVSPLFYSTCFGKALFVTQNSGQIKARPFYPSAGHTTSFNIPHQNSDEDEPFILPVDVA